MSFSYDPAMSLTCACEFLLGITLCSFLLGASFSCERPGGVAWVLGDGVWVLTTLLFLKFQPKTCVSHRTGVLPMLTYMTSLLGHLFPPLQRRPAFLLGQLPRRYGVLLPTRSPMWDGSHTKFTRYPRSW